MIKLLTIRNHIIWCGFLFLLCLPVISSAQSSLSLSVTPTLFDISVSPDQRWQSRLRVINPNDYEITIYTQPVNFTPLGEDGRGNFLPILEQESEGLTLAEWFTIENGPITIDPFATAEIPFTLDVPADAPPGGMFAAVLISTQPPATAAGTQVRTSQAVSALFFLRVEGDISESGAIRSFSTARRLVQRPENDFTLRFENTGNVHIQPQGDITIYNMWGEERGVIPINHRSQYGNVLPDSIRAFNFSWRSEYSLVDIGRYRADVTLAYGRNDRSFVSRSVYFWVIPVYGVLLTVGSIIVFIVIVSWLIRLYVRRMLQLAGLDRTMVVPRRHVVLESNPASAQRLVWQTGFSWLQAASQPIRVAASDVWQRLRQPGIAQSKLSIVRGIGYDYRYAFVAMLVIIASVTSAVWFFNSVQQNRAFEVVIQDGDTGTTISSEELYYQQLVREPQSSMLNLNKEALALTTELLAVPVTISNISGRPGAAADLRVQLESLGVSVEDLKTDFNRTENRTVIVYTPELQSIALSYSRLLGGALLSAAPENGQNSQLIIYLGLDVVQ